MVDPKDRTIEEEKALHESMSPADYMDMKEAEARQAIGIEVTPPESLLYDPGFWLMVICIMATIGVVLHRIDW